MLRQTFFAITCSYQIMNSVTIVAATTVAATFRRVNRTKNIQQNHEFPIILCLE